MPSNNPAYFPCLEDLCIAAIAVDIGQYKGNFASLIKKLQRRSRLFDVLEREFKIFYSPFSETISDVPTDMQLEITKLQSDFILKKKFASVGIEIYKHLFPGY